MSEGIQSNDQGGTVINLLDDVVLTATFSDNESAVYQMAPFSQLELIIDYTEDSSENNNSANVKLLLSEDGTDFHEYSIGYDQEPAANVVASILYPRRFQVTGTPNVKETRWFAVPTIATYFKVQANEHGLQAVGGRLTAKARVGVNTTFR